MSNVKKLFKLTAFLGLFLLGLGLAAAVGVYLYFSPTLPDVEQLRDVQLQTPLRVYSSDGKLIAEFGEKRRTPITFEEVPPRFVQAILAAEDSRFFEHPGVDIKGLMRAAVQLASTGRIQSGGSTITMQVAKNYFLTRERTFTRKFSEILLALRIEQELSKEEILELYLNKIYLGNRAYGLQAAAQVYYGRPVSDLTLAELAMIAGLPKAPSAYNPLANPTRALERRNWILGRMHELAYIEDQAYEEAINAPVSARYHGADIEVEAPYVAEMVRTQLYERFGEAAYTDGLRVYTTLHSELQRAANSALRQGLIEYDLRHGYRGPEQKLQELGTLEEQIKTLNKTPTYGPLEPALVLTAEPQSLRVQRKNGQTLTLPWEALSWARPYRSESRTGAAPKSTADIAEPGDLIRIRQEDQRWVLAQLPDVQGALVALAPRNGALKALVGGFDFQQSKFNRATQATRQPGSNFKPFIYTAALDNGFTPASIINDAPVVFEDRNLESTWRPENYSKQFYGPTRLREALYKSRNLVSIRILRSLGVADTLDYLGRFGFDPQRLPNNLSLSLGTADVTPLELVTAYASFANRGYKVAPHFIERIETLDGQVIEQTYPDSVCEACRYLPPPRLEAASTTDAPEPLPETDVAATTPPDQAAQNAEQAPAAGTDITHNPLAPRILDERTVYLINNIMQDVIKRGTGQRAKKLKRSDLAGKTGTTNDQKDAWFSGFNSDLVASVWVGFDQPKPLGRNEFGSTAALPIWIDFMADALKDSPEVVPAPPEKIVSVRIDPKTGLLAYPGQADAIFELFREENVPKQVASSTRHEGAISTDELF